MIAMSNQKNQATNNGGKVDRQILFTPPGSEQESVPPPAQRDPQTGRFLPGQSGNPAGKTSLQELTKNFRIALLNENKERAAKVAAAWLNSGDPFVQKLYFEYIVGKPKVQQEQPGAGQDNIAMMRSAMQAFNRLQELEAENARMKAELERRTVEG
jgi:hypothetical protein